MTHAWNVQLLVGHGITHWETSLFNNDEIKWKDTLILFLFGDWMLMELYISLNANTAHWRQSLGAPSSCPPSYTP